MNEIPYGFIWAFLRLSFTRLFLLFRSGRLEAQS